MAQVTSLSSTGTATIIVNPVPRTTSVVLTVASGSSGGVITVEATLDDPSIGSPTLTWAPISSGSAMLSSNVTGYLYTVLSPIGGVRLNSTAIGNATFTLKTLQSVTA